MFNPIFKENVQGQKHPGSSAFVEPELLVNVKEAWIIDQRVINGLKNPSDSHNYHDENHDEIEFYLGNSDRSTWWHSTLAQRTPKNQSDWLYGYGVLLTNVQCHRYLYPHHDIKNTGTYNWKHTWNHTVSSYKANLLVLMQPWHFGRCAARIQMFCH